MSQENVDVVRAFLAAWNARDMDAGRELHDPHIIFTPAEGWFEPGPYVGREEVMRWFEQLREAWVTDTFEATSDFIDVDDRVVVRLIWRGVGRHGPEANMVFTIIYTVREGRICRQAVFWDHDEALQAAGLE
jgi:ketosteroid isomerase-like protein